jgi:hypothetical protein
MKYFYARTDLFGSTWVECDRNTYLKLGVKGVMVKSVAPSFDDEPINFDDDDEPSDTPLKDACLEALSDTVPAIFREMFDAVVEEDDLKATPEEVQYYIDEDLIDPDYDDEDLFGDSEEEVSEEGVALPVSSSSSNPNKWFVNPPISLPNGVASSDDVKRVQRAIYTLMEGGMVKESDELDGDRFVSRLETNRDVTINTHQKNRANPSILFMPDFSPSCVSYATLYNTILGGVSAIRDDFNVVSAPHFNGLPKWFTINGVRDKRAMEMFEQDWVEEDDQSWGRVSEHAEAQKFYADVIAKRCALYDINTVIIAGDMDGTWCYKLLLDNPQVERMIWLDGSYWSDDTSLVTRTSELLYKLDITGAKRTLAKSKLVYWSGVKTVKDFVRAIERSNSW